jgi:hypothetical protein
MRITAIQANITTAEVLLSQQYKLTHTVLQIQRCVCPLYYAGSALHVHACSLVWLQTTCQYVTPLMLQCSASTLIDVEKELFV